VKKFPLKALFSTAFFFVAVSGYASTSTLETMSDDTFAYTRQGSTAFDRDIEKLTNKAKEDAAKLCASKGKQLKILDIAEEKPFFSLGYAKVKVTFKALDAGDPLLASNDPVVGHSVKDTREAVTVRSSGTNDLYNDLLKLDDLRKRGILTDEEFQAEKKKVLNRSK